MSDSDDFLGDSSAEVDIFLIEINLRMSPQERIEAHQAALDLVLELEKAGHTLRAKS